MSSGTSGDAWKDLPGGSAERRAPGFDGTVTSVVEPAATSAEQHLGDRLTALVDGELGHDTRERVLAHLATCDQCRVVADEQRRLKTVFAAAAPPPPSQWLLARLQGLPAGDEDDDGQGTFRGLGGALSALLDPPDPSGPGDGGASAGFPMHEFAKPSRPSAHPHRGRRFAFAAAGAFSLAAVALSGALQVDGVAESPTEEPGSAVTPMVGRAETTTVDSTSGPAPGGLHPPVSAIVPGHQPMRLAPHSGPLPSVATPTGSVSLLRWLDSGSSER